MREFIYLFNNSICQVFLSSCSCVKLTLHICLGLFVSEAVALTQTWMKVVLKKKKRMGQDDEAEVLRGYLDETQMFKSKVIISLFSNK